MMRLKLSVNPSVQALANLHLHLANAHNALERARNVSTPSGPYGTRPVLLNPSYLKLRRMGTELYHLLLSLEEPFVAARGMETPLIQPSEPDKWLRWLDAHEQKETTT